MNVQMLLVFGSLEVQSIRILLIYPEIASFYIDTSKVIHGLSPPLGLLYIASFLEEAGHKVSVVDFSAESFSMDRLRRLVTDVEVVGISVLTPGLKNVSDIIGCCRSTNPKVIIVIGGPHCTLLPKSSLVDLDADICVQGDGEYTLLKVIQQLCAKKDFVNIPVHM